MKNPPNFVIYCIMVKKRKQFNPWPNHYPLAYADKAEAASALLYYKTKDSKLWAKLKTAYVQQYGPIS